MAYPIHPGLSVYDLNYSVLYDDFDAIAAVKAIEDLDKQEAFPPPPPFTYSLIVRYRSTNNGVLEGSKVEWVGVGDRPSHVPEPINDKTHEFLYWTVEDEQVDPHTYQITENTTFVAHFREIEIKNYTITLYSIRQNSDQAQQQGLTTKQIVLEAGQSFNVSEFGIETGRVFDSSGALVSGNRITPEGDDWYQCIDYSESLATSGSGYTAQYEKVVYSGFGGRIRVGNTTKYADSQNYRQWGGSYTTPTTVPDSGFEFHAWYNLDTGARATSLPGSTSVNHFAAIFIES